MKKLYISIFLIGLLAFAGCNKWLDVKPQSEVREPDIYANETGFKSVLNGVYIQMGQRELYGMYSSFYFTDLLAQLWNTKNNSREKEIAGYNYKHQNVAPVIESMWRKYFSSIGNINNLLENLESTDIRFSHGNKEIIKGEALGLRAFLHLELLRLFGPVPKNATDDMVAIPYITELTKDPSKLLTKTYGEVKSHIISDLDSAAVYLKNDPLVLYDSEKAYRDSSHLYRPTHLNFYAVDATKARFYQWIGEKEKATEIAKSIIDAKKSDSTSKFVLANNENSYTVTNGKNLVMECEHLFGVHSSNMQNIIDKVLVSGDDPKLFQTVKNVGTMFEGDINSSDIRNITGRYWLVGDASTGMMYHKYNGNALILAINKVPLIRLAEMYLIVVENDVLDEAKKYFTTYRQARAMSTNVEILSEADRLPRVEKEYLKDFFAEGQMFFYYKRHAIPKFTIPVSFTVPVNGYVIPKPDNQLVFE